MTCVEDRGEHSVAVSTGIAWSGETIYFCLCRIPFTNWRYRALALRTFSTFACWSRLNVVRSMVPPSAPVRPFATRLTSLRGIYLILAIPRAIMSVVVLRYLRIE